MSSDRQLFSDDAYKIAKIAIQLAGGKPKSSHYKAAIKELETARIHERELIVDAMEEASKHTTVTLQRFLERSNSGGPFEIRGVKMPSTLEKKIREAFPSAKELKEFEKVEVSSLDVDREKEKLPPEMSEFAVGIARGRKANWPEHKLQNIKEISDLRSAGEIIRSDTLTLSEQAILVRFCEG